MIRSRQLHTYILPLQDWFVTDQEEYLYRSVTQTVFIITQYQTKGPVYITRYNMFNFSRCAV